MVHADGSPVRVLAVDDEPSITELVAMALRYEGWEVRTAGTGADAVRQARDFDPDVIVLDMMLPDLDGLEVMRRVRSVSPDTPVIFLTARDAVADRVAGLTAGGDDYVTKPFSLEELVARVRSLLRRTTAALPAEPASRLVVGDLVMDEDSHEVWRGDDPVKLTATEFELLRYLMRNPRRVLSKAQILDRVWQYDFGGQANVVELYISYLRKKIDAGRPAMIHTLRGAGYVLRPAAEARTVRERWPKPPRRRPRSTGPGHLGASAAGPGGRGGHPARGRPEHGRHPGHPTPAGRPDRRTTDRGDRPSATRPPGRSGWDSRRDRSARTTDRHGGDRAGAGRVDDWCGPGGGRLHRPRDTAHRRRRDGARARGS
ncbi:MAG TPA: response regulator transcription factor [Candidatus Avipropionibacterium avicola]|uniref:Response regulator transcription factor n=1 Tax=Candidatus Avipropionibacterium avicola TaxID=2840701 RepID=A0A9D1KNI6_9ACTN|nr:response regulator transcription factor [Candidatus Avipropionibacterium avicola]